MQIKQRKNPFFTHFPISVHYVKGRFTPFNVRSEARCYSFIVGWDPTVMDKVFNFSCAYTRYVQQWFLFNRPSMVDAWGWCYVVDHLPPCIKKR